MKTEAEIRLEISKAIAQREGEDQTQRRSDYLDGVEEALNWVVGLSEDPPTEI